MGIPLKVMGLYSGEFQDVKNRAAIYPWCLENRQLIKDRPKYKQDGITDQSTESPSYYPTTYESFAHIPAV